MNAARTRLLESVRARSLVSDDDVAVAQARRGEYRAFGVDVDLIDVLSTSGSLPDAEVEEARRGEDLPSRVAGLDIVRLAGGTPEYPVYLARRAVDGETFLVHACMLSRRDAPAEVDAFVKAMENGRRLTRSGWIAVREATGAEGAYAAVVPVPEGVRLDERLSSGGYLSPTDAVATAKLVAEALWSIEALGLAAPFPDPSLVLLGPKGTVSLPAIEVLRALRPGRFDPAETARSAANFIARLVGPERLGDPAIRGLLADLSSGRFDGLAREKPRDFVIGSPASSDGTATFDVEAKTPVHTDTLLLDEDEVHAAKAPPHPSTGRGTSRPEASASHRAQWVALAGVAVTAGIGFFVFGRGGAGPASPVTERPDGESADAGPSRRQAPVNPTPIGGPKITDPGVEALDAALAYQLTHRDDDPRGVIDKFRAIEARFGGNELAMRAGAAREQFGREVEADATRRAETAASDVQRFLKSEEIGAALAAVERFPKALAFTNAAVRIEALRGQVKERAEAVFTSLRDVLDAAGDPAKQTEIDAALDRIKSLGDPELSTRAKIRVADAKDRAGGAFARRKELAPDLERVVGEALVAAGAGDGDRARRLVDTAQRGPLAAPFRDRLTSLRESVDRIGFLLETAAGELRARIGKPATLTLREYGAKPFTVTVTDAAADRLTYTRGGIAGAARVRSLDPDCVVALATGSGREADGGLALAAATFLASTGRVAQADVLRARAESLGSTLTTFDAETAAARATLTVAAARESAAGDAVAERDRDGARAAWGRAALIAPYEPSPHRRLGESFLAEKRLDDAFVELRRARALGDRSPDALFALARASASRPDDEALAAWREFLAAAPKTDTRVETARAEADRLSGRVVHGTSSEKARAAKALLDAGKPEDAVDALELIVAEDPTSLEAWRLLGRASEKAGNPLRAFLAWLEARNVAKRLQDVTDAKEQLDRLDRTYGARPAEVSVRTSGEESLSKGEFAAAADMLERAVAMAPLDVDARLGLGSALMGVAVRTNAKAVFERGAAAFDAAIRLAPDDARGYAGRAELKRWRGDAVGAVTDATAAIERRKDFVSAYNTRGLAHYQALEFDAALADMSVVTTMAPLLATPRITRAAVQTALGRYDEATADLNAALERNPTETEKQQIAALEQQVAARRKADGK